jgi:hypothetical protein
MSIFISTKSDGLGKMLGVGLVIVVIFMIKLWADVYGYVTATTIISQEEMISASMKTAGGMLLGLALMGLSMLIRHWLSRDSKSDEQS